MAEQPEQVEEPVELVARVAGIDVAKDSGMVCTRVPHRSRAGRRVQQVWSVPARFAAVSELADQLVELGSSGWCWSPRRTTGGSGST